MAYLPSPPSPLVSRVSEAFSLLTTSIVRVYMYIYIYSFRASNLLLDRSLNFLARPRRRRGRKRRVFFFPPRERIIPLDCTIKRERERGRLYDAITFSQGDVKSLGSDTSFSREKETRLILPRKNLLSRSISRSRDKRLRENVKRYEKMANTNVNREKRR